MEQMDWTTGQIAKRTGLTVRALRYYDRIGLLKPSRLHGSTRLYSEGDIARDADCRNFQYSSISGLPSKK
jgi:DNA-binding transcriptional MerR regulator